MTRRHRRHSTEKKREVVEAYLNGEALQALSRRHDVCRSLIRIWIGKYERGSNDDDAVDLPHFIECIYNATRLHSALGYLSPNK
ncbi:MAG: transposase, partial [Boseongicola sp.]|nr:transposase [Boseongicola sp.]